MSYKCYIEKMPATTKKSTNPFWMTEWDGKQNIKRDRDR